MQSYNDSTAFRQLQTNPRKVMDGARRGVKEDLGTLSYFWSEMAPELLKMDLFSIFYGHLDLSLVPTSTIHDHSASGGCLANKPAVDRASLSLIALTKLGKIVNQPHSQTSLPSIGIQTLNAWPGIYAWCTFLYITRIEPEATMPALRRITMDVIGEVLCSLSQFDNVREVIADTPGAIELATRIWIVEDTCPVPSTTSSPVNTAALEDLLSFPSWFNPPNESQPHHQFMDPVAVDEEVMKGRETLSGQRDKVVRPRLDCVVSAAGGISRLVGLALSRLRAIIANAELIRGTGTAITLGLIGQLCRSSTHPLRFKFLDKGLITLVTELAVTVVGMLDLVVVSASNGRRQITSSGTGTLQESQAQQRLLQDSLVSCFTLLFNTMESTDGHTWVKEAISAGLLQAWVDAAGHIHNFSPEDAEMVVEIMSVLLPKYMAFKTVINPANGALKKIKHEARLDACRDPEMKKAWTAFRKMTTERSNLDRQVKALQFSGCSNYANCQNLDVKKTFMRCSGCSQALYCSRNCQRDDWRAGHKRVCNLPPQERLEIYQAWKSNEDHFHRLVVNDAIRHLPTLKRLAESAYPLLAKSPTSFVITIDYMVYPPKLGLHLLSEHSRYALRHTLKVGPTAELHNDELVQRSLNNPGKYGIIQSKRTEGQQLMHVLSVISGDVLEAKWGALDQLALQQVG